jgi:hypothetical protein
MECPIYDGFIKEWNAATWEDTRALDAHISHGMSVARRQDWRDRARAALRSVEFKLNSHIQECTACKADGRTPTFNMSEARE